MGYKKYHKGILFNRFLHVGTQFFSEKFGRWEFTPTEFSPKSPPLGPFYTITTHLASENHSSLTPQHDSETRSTADIPVRVFLNNLRTVRDVTSLPLEV